MVPSGLRDYLASSPEFRVEETEAQRTFSSPLVTRGVCGPAGSKVRFAVPGLVFAGTFDALCCSEVEGEALRNTVSQETLALGPQCPVPILPTHFPRLSGPGQGPTPMLSSWWPVRVSRKRGFQATRSPLGCPPFLLLEVAVTGQHDPRGGDTLLR